MRKTRKIKNIAQLSNEKLLELINSPNLDKKNYATVHKEINKRGLTV